MDNAIVKKHQDLRSIMRSDEITTRFSEVVGGENAGSYISSVLIAVAQNDELKKCDTNSIIASALRAATMRLSVDPSSGHAYIVPFKGKATLIVGYKGIYHMAIRTGKYRFINLITVYESDQMDEDVMTGNIQLSRHGKKGDKVVGYLLYFQLLTGFSKTFYMTCDECDAHGKQYSKNYAYDTSLWKKDPHAMYKKTVIRLGLTKWGYLDPYDMVSMSQEEDETDYVEGVIVKQEPSRSVNQNLKELGFDIDGEEEELSEGEQEPKKVTTVEFWNESNKKFNNDHEKGKELLEKHGGDLDAAYHELTKL